MATLLGLIDFLFPKTCVGCKASGSYLCAKCRQTVEYFPFPLCPACGKLIPKLGIHHWCQNSSELDGLIAIGQHRGPLKKLVQRLKYSGHFDMAATGGELLLTHLPPSLSVGVFITSVPLHSVRERTRGYNQSELLGKYLGKQLGLPYERLLRKTRATQAQAGLKRQARLINLRDVFSPITPLLRLESLGPILIVDDVATTGATLNECAKVLKTAGAKKVYGAVLSHGG